MEEFQWNSTQIPSFFIIDDVHNLSLNIAMGKEAFPVHIVIKKGSLKINKRVIIAKNLLIHITILCVFLLAVGVSTD